MVKKDSEAARSALKGQKACVLWLTGLSGTGKSTIANLVEKKLHAMGGDPKRSESTAVGVGRPADGGFNEMPD